MERSEVYNLIDGERDYQDSISGDMEHKDIEAEIRMMEEYIKKTRETWDNHGDSTPALDMMRKVIGIGVRCFENHGCPLRSKKRKFCQRPLVLWDLKYPPENTDGE